MMNRWLVARAGRVVQVILVACNLDSTFGLEAGLFSFVVRYRRRQACRSR